MFLHLVDDEKFTDASISLFEKCDPGNHRYVLISESVTEQPRYIRSGRVEYIRKDSSQYKVVAASLASFDAVFVYSLFNKYHLDLVNRAPQDAKFVWFFGGGELLTSKKYWKTVMLPQTRMLYYRHKAIPWLKTNVRKYSNILRHGDIKALAQTFHKRFSHRQQGNAVPLDTNLEKAIARFDYVAPVIPEDYEQLKKMTFCNAKLLNWNYPFDKFSLEHMKDWTVSGQNWLVGNAARYALNHLEIMKRLRSIKGHNGKIIVPLSYGDSDLYRDDIIRTGYKWFNGRFEPLTEFMPFDAYFAYIRSCAAAFFNTPRQHAMGNTMILLYLGSKVFLREENPIYHYLKSQGAAVFSIQRDIAGDAAVINKPLTLEQVKKNKLIVETFGDQSVIDANTRKMIEVLR